ncbi:thioredoxin domain-containing protein [Actinospica durhamensis]|uniref:Thioredoxin domain-containing protein n=1 Tax=Actinospica durhamensis TaxID=1508375 RepID=A0A941EMG7_9ACTN|nr:DsbA family protein [Actinospica durhamensis]MBR7833227.1 thioredoxin domain-containing protein [Actinospica durhamensis]
MAQGTLTVPVGPADHVIGPDDAPITVVEYGDYECPYCGQAYPVTKELINRFGLRLRFVFRNLPLADMHPHAQHAAEAAEAAALQDRFWPMHDLLYENQQNLQDDALLDYARQAGADAEAVEQALVQGATRKRVEADLESALRSGANGTPTFFVNGQRYDQSWDLQTFSSYLDSVAPEASQ